MRYMVKYKDKKLADNVVKASTFSEKLVGLMFSKDLGDKEGLLFETKSIHTHFMRYAIDVVFMNKDYKIIKIFRGMKPWRMTGIFFKASYAIEFEAGKITDEISEGEYLDVICIS